MSNDIVTIFNGNLDNEKSNIKFDTVDNILYLMTDLEKIYKFVIDVRFDINKIIKQIFDSGDYSTTLYKFLNGELVEGLKEYKYYHEAKYDSFRLFITMLFSAVGVFYRLDKKEDIELNFIKNDTTNGCKNIELAIPYIFNIVDDLNNEISDMINGLFEVGVCCSECEYVYTIQNQISNDNTLKDQYLELYNAVKNDHSILEDSSTYESYKLLCKHIFICARSLADAKLVKNGRIRIQ